MNRSTAVNEDAKQTLELLNKAIKESNGTHDDILIILELITSKLLIDALNPRRVKAIVRRNNQAKRVLEGLISIDDDSFREFIDSIVSIEVPNTTKILDEYLMGGQVESKEFEKVAINDYNTTIEVLEDTFVINFNYYESDLEVNEVNYVMRNGVMLELMDSQEKEVSEVLFKNIKTV
jgi:hypothetical protein